MAGRSLLLELLKLLVLLESFGFDLVKAEEFSDARMYSVEPNRIGNGGGVITINGINFAGNNFNEFEPHLGNKVCPEARNIFGCLSTIDIFFRFT